MDKELSKILPANEPKLKPGPLGIIPVSSALFSGNENKYLKECIDTAWVSCQGGFIPKFEREFAAYCQSGFGISCSSGTAALHLALASSGINKDDEVIMPAFTMISTASAVYYQGATPVLVDSVKPAFNIDPARIEEKITKKTKAIIAVHIYGHPADMGAINRIAKKHGLYVIEDAAEAHGAQYQHKKTGSLGDVACFSFYGNKIITTGEGGMVVTSNRKIKERAEYLRDLAFDIKRHFWHKDLGFNYRMSNLQAAVGLAQVEKIDQLVNIRRRNAQAYNQMLSGIKGVVLPDEARGTLNVYWMYAIVIEKEYGMSRDELRKALADKGVETRAFFIPIHLQPVFNSRKTGSFPVAEEACKKGLYLPSGAALKKDEIGFIATIIKKLGVTK